MSSEPSCLFCKIIAGKIPSRRIYEDDHAVAFLDVAPWHRGHSLVEPKRHIDDLLSAPPTLSEITAAVEATASLLVERLGADGLNMLSSARAVAGQEVFHLHVHLIPRYAATPGLRALIGPRAATDSELDEVHAVIMGGQ